MAREDEDKGAPQRFVALDVDARREWLARPEVRRILVSISFYKFGLRGPDIDDLVQDFYAKKVFPLARAYAPDRDDLALVRTSFGKFALNWLRDRKRLNAGGRLSFVDPDQLAIVSGGVVPPFPEHLGPDERVVALRWAKDRLSDADRRMIQMVDFEGLSHQDAAHRLGMTVGAVKVGIHRAKKRLKALVIDEGFCLCPDDITDWSIFAVRLASGFDGTDKAVSAFCGMLPPGTQIVLPELANRSAARKRLLREVNGLLRSSDLNRTVALDAGAMPGRAAALELHRRIQGNRLIVESLFDPLIVKAAQGAEEQ